MSVIREIEKGKRERAKDFVWRSSPVEEKRKNREKGRKCCQFSWLSIEKVPNTLEENRRLP